MRKVMLSALAAIAVIAAASTNAEQQAAAGNDRETRKFYAFDGIPVVGPNEHPWTGLLPRPRMLHAASSDSSSSGPVVIYLDAAWNSIWPNDVAEPLGGEHLVEQMLHHTHPDIWADEQTSVVGVSVKGAPDDHARMEWIL